MPDLIAQGPTADDRWRRELPDPTSGVELVVGRSGADWNVPWDAMISRAHVRIGSLADNRVEVFVMPTARNPVFHQGRQSKHFRLVPGDHFAIGRTTFTLVNRPGISDNQGAANQQDASSDWVADDVTEHAFDHVALRQKSFRNSVARIDMLSRLPDLIASSGSDDELLVRVAGVLLKATPAASAVAILKVRDSQDVTILHYDSRSDDLDSPAVSARLARSATARRESVLHVWSASWAADAVSVPAFTANEQTDWAFCVPLRSEACPGWALYVTGHSTAGHDDIQHDALQDEVKFAELVGTTIANLRQSRRLQRRQAELRHFFAPLVMDAMAGRDPDEVLQPREADLSVIFCDLRGFSRQSERDSQNLLDLLARVSDALGVMTRHILDTDGVIGDFHGDAAMGFWGWPLDQTDAAVRAARAACRIREEYGRDHSTDGFRCGIGIATGRAVAGRIGTSDQVKVTAFGPVVNLASRLEGATKAFGAEIIIDESTARQIESLTDAEAEREDFRLRRLARVRPAGMERAILVYELLSKSLPDSPPNSPNNIDNDVSTFILTPAQIRQYETGLDAMIEGRWDEAFEYLDGLPANDQPKESLLAILERYDRVPPPNWNGVIDLPKL